MDIDEVIGVWFIASFVVNLLHFHGDGKFDYVPKCFSGRAGKIWFWMFWLALGIAGVVVRLQNGFGIALMLLFWSCGQTYSIWARHRERVQRREQTQSSIPAAA
ncbi:MAG TPA: hypothetical protein VHC44_10450 [Verrucomicrobiae bacterium]|nr:hypothetical protein [Verrucomicrobiae bacterium]